MDGFPKENWKRQSLLRDVLVVTISETLARIFFILSRNYQYHHPNVLSKSSFERSTLLTLSKLIYREFFSKIRYINSSFISWSNLSSKNYFLTLS